MKLNDAAFDLSNGPVLDEVGMLLASATQRARFLGIGIYNALEIVAFDRW